MLSVRFVQNPTSKHPLPTHINRGMQSVFRAGEETEQSGGERLAPIGYSSTAVFPLPGGVAMFQQGLNHSMTFLRWLGPCYLVCLLGFPGPWENPALMGQQDTGPERPVDESIRRWIDQLGSEQFVVREQAQEELRRLGVAAFDALIEAQDHDDIEIASRARYLVRSIPIRWTMGQDASEVKSLMRNYAEASRVDRRSRMQQLATLPNSEGVAALCRIVRFETDNLLSKEAALLVLQHTAPSLEVRRQSLADRVNSTLGTSRRPGAAWLRTYTLTLQDPSSSLAEWEQLSRREELVAAESPQDTSPEIVRDLLRWQSNLLRQQERPDEALQVARRTLNLLRGDRKELLDVVDWALENQIWQLVDDVSTRFPERFQMDAELMYRVAEAQFKQDKNEQAEETARQALALNPGVPERHAEVAIFLMQRQRYDWAEAEFRFAIRSSERENWLTLESRYLLADMLFDLQRYEPAGQVLQEALERLEADVRLGRESRRSAEIVRGQMHYFYAEHFVREGNRTRQLEELEKAIAAVPDQPDYIIAMYRVPEPTEAWKERTQQLLTKTIAAMREKIAAAEQALRNPRTPNERDMAAIELAQACNEYAWLVSNTEGDLKDALRRSQQAVELAPDSEAYLDTLGRCHFALGDLANAIKFQSTAVAKAPYLQQLRRQLQLFQDTAKSP